MGGISRFTLQVRIKIRASVGRFLASAGRSKTPTAVAPFYLRAFRFNRGRGERYRKNVTKGMQIRDIGLKVGRLCAAGLCAAECEFAILSSKSGDFAQRKKFLEKWGTERVTLF